MECLCEMLPYPHPPQAHAYYQQQLQQQQQMYAPYLQQQQQQQQLEEQYLVYGAPDYTDFRFTQGPYYEELEDAGEPSTRSRLTKEQVEVLERQFQENHKPTSMQKRQLAMQTMLSLPRVANWFQNRRAKAKQQKKQEEYENSQTRETPLNDVHDGEVKADTLKVETDNSSFESPRSNASRPSSSPASNSFQEVEALRQSRLASYASVDRLQSQQLVQEQQSLPSAAIQIPHTPTTDVHAENHQRSVSTVSRSQMGQWARKPELMGAWSETHQHFQDTTFDFGFTEAAHSGPVQHDPGHGTYHEEASFSNSMLPPDAWPQSMTMPPTFHDPAALQDELPSPDLPFANYPDSRRGSGTDSLAANFGTFALGTPGQEIPLPVSTESSELRQPEMHLDLAARRKRPRPAALTSASLRSRSYGALTATSPTVRSGFTPPAHTVRHVKSMGHGLNTTHYAGIRKPSSAQRSPLTVNTFAEAEAFKTLMAQHVSDAAPLSATTLGSSTPVASPGLTINTQVGDHAMNRKADLARSYQLAASQHLTLATASPPRTPFAPEYTSHGHMQVPPVSAPPQYASFADTTPPYSAGPLTNSSWPDAPLTSPDAPNFQTHYLPPLPTMNQGMEPAMPGYPPFVLPSDGKMTFEGADTNPEPRRTEFYIQEFPNQREEHANVAQQLAQNRPRNYVFANTAPSDYDQT